MARTHAQMKLVALKLVRAMVAVAVPQQGDCEAIQIPDVQMKVQLEVKWTWKIWENLITKTTSRALSLVLVPQRVGL